jgi:hypothetical protein
VNFVGLQNASFTIEIYAYIKVATYNDFLISQQKLLLKILTAVSNAGVRLSIASQTAYLEAADIKAPTVAPQKQDKTR